MQQIGGYTFSPPTDTSASEGAKAEWQKYIQYLKTMIESEGASQTVLRSIKQFRPFHTVTWDSAWGEAFLAWVYDPRTSEGE